MKQSATRKLVMAAMCAGLGRGITPGLPHGAQCRQRTAAHAHPRPAVRPGPAGWPYGLACGILAPLLSSLLTGMPPAAYLPSMLCELAAYGLVSGLMSQFIRLRSRTASVYVQLVSAMLAGRVVYGVVNALIFRAGSYSFQIFFTAAFVTALPGIILQLLVIPPILVLLQKARVLEPQPTAA